MKANNVSKDWMELRKEIFSPQENLESDLRVELIGEIIKARENAQLSQMKLSKAAGIKQPVLARIESGISDPRLSTIIKILAPMGKTIRIVPIDEK